LSLKETPEYYKSAF